MELVGLRAIARYMGWGPQRVTVYARRYGFPLMRLPRRLGIASRYCWRYVASTEDIQWWKQSMFDATRKHIEALPSSGPRRKKKAKVRESRPHD